MKDHIDLDSQTKKVPGRDVKEIAGSFWSAASVFSKKSQKWRQRGEMMVDQRDCQWRSRLGENTEKPSLRLQIMGLGGLVTQEPGFSLDAGRMSYDDPRCSFDEPRASWDGYLIGRTFPRMPTMVSVAEDAPVMRFDAQIPVEDESLPGGSAPTKDYYSDSSSRRRKRIDRSSSIRKTAADVVGRVPCTFHC